MPAYTYVASDGAGNVSTGTIEAADKESVREDLRKMQYHALRVGERRESILRKWRAGVRRGDLVVFARQLAAMHDAGLPLVTALGVIEEDSEEPRLKEIVRDVCEQVESGSSLCDAIGRHKGVFPNFFVGMIEAGETGGALNVVLERVAVHLEKQEELRQKVVSALAYPVVVSVLSCLVTAFLVVFVVPVFASAYAGAGARLPAPTVALVAISDFVRAYWWAILGALAASALAWRNIRHMKAAERALDAVMMNAPLVGRLNRKVAASRFVRTFSVMAASGVPLVAALSVGERAAGSHLMSNAVRAIREPVTAGGSVSEPMRLHRAFPSMIVQMAATGEASGTMPEMLERSADFLDRDIDRVIKRLIVVLEPMASVALAAVVGFILLAVYLPMFDILTLAGE